MSGRTCPNSQNVMTKWTQMTVEHKLIKWVHQTKELESGLKGTGLGNDSIVHRSVFNPNICNNSSCNGLIWMPNKTGKILKKEQA